MPQHYGAFSGSDIMDGRSAQLMRPLMFAYLRAREPGNPNAVREGEFNIASRRSAPMGRYGSLASQTMGISGRRPGAGPMVGGGPPDMGTSYTQLGGPGGYPVPPAAVTGGGAGPMAGGPGGPVPGWASALERRGVTGLVDRVRGIPDMPWSRPGGPWSADDPFKDAKNLQDPIRGMIRTGGLEGVFRPDYLTELMRKRVLRNAGALRSRAGILSQLAGLDPMQARSAMVGADIAANAGTVGALNEAEMADAENYRNMIRDLLYRERYGVEAPAEAANINRRWEEEMQGGGFGDFLGGVAGLGLGGLTGSGLGAGAVRSFL